MIVVSMWVEEVGVEAATGNCACVHIWGCAYWWAIAHAFAGLMLSWW